MLRICLAKCHNCGVPTLLNKTGSLRNTLGLILAHQISGSKILFSVENFDVLVQKICPLLL
jgi:hypothetical protein